MLRIGVDASAWCNQRGYGRHVRALLSRMLAVDTQNQYTFFIDTAADEYALPAGANAVTVAASTPAAIAAKSDGRRGLPDMWRMSRALSSHNLDMVLFPTVYSYVPVFSKAKIILMIHDIIAETFPEMTMPSRKAQLFWRAKVAAGRWQADAIATVSEYSRQNIARHFGLDPAKIYTVGEASAPVFRRLPAPPSNQQLQSIGVDPDRRHIVYVGGFGPHKNLGRLIEAVANMINADPTLHDLKLAFVGEYEREVFHSEIDRLKAQIEDLGLNEHVLFTGYLPDEALVALLNVAALLVLPSLMEGYGLPAVEAAACGCPVVATTESPLPQLLGDAGLFVAPTDRPALEAALTRVLKSASLRKKMGDAGLRAAASLTWDHAAQQMIDMLNEVAAS